MWHQQCYDYLFGRVYLDFSRVYLDLPIYWGSIWHKGLFGRNSLTVRMVYTSNPKIDNFKIHWKAPDVSFFVKNFSGGAG